MKHKTFFCLSLASMLALSFAGLTACGDSGNQNGGGTGGNQGGTGGGTTEPTVTPDRTAAAFGDPAATFTLDGKVNINARNTISDTLFGVFLEDINYAGYLLDDNLVYNGSFESFISKQGGWTASGAAIAIASQGGVLSGEQYYGAKNVDANYANVTVTAANGSISNAGQTHMPIAVESGVKYIFSAFIKAAQGTTLTVRVTDGTTVYCEAAVNVKGGSEWIKYEQTLTANASADENVKLELAFADTGTYSVDGISLETQNATGGIKQYVFDAVKDLAPKFVRFPGGCIIEGDYAGGGADCYEVYDWKNSIGAVQTGTAAGADDVPAFQYKLVKDGEETTATTHGEWITRTQNSDLWGYDLEYGVGFYEFFLLCDNLGASAVPVVNCGLSDMGGAAQGDKGKPLNGRHGQKVNDYIQDAIDLIEFAKGDKTTKWGAIRAALGHEEPFAMDYIGIGNEQSGDDYYKKCYWKFLQSEAFQNALETYNVKPIVGNGMFLSNCESYSANGNQTKGTAQIAADEAVFNGVVDTVSDFGVVDQHYYVNYMVLFSRTKMYDDYARPASDPDNYYEVFVGEYSANEGTDQYPLYKNSLITALSEAAMMTGYERNGDIIKLAAYAPMFGVADMGANAQAGGADSSNQWAVDMMYYNNTEILRSANYYVQQLFMQNQGKYRLPDSRLEYADGVASTYSVMAAGGSTSQTIDKLYTVASKAADGSFILKVVNASPDAMKLNIAIQNAQTKNYAYLTELYNAESDRFAINTMANKEEVVPRKEVVGFAEGSLGQELKPYSVTVLRFPAA